MRETTTTKPVESPVTEARANFEAAVDRVIRARSDLIKSDTHSFSYPPRDLVTAVGDMLEAIRLYIASVGMVLPRDTWGFFTQLEVFSVKLHGQHRMGWEPKFWRNQTGWPEHILNGSLEQLLHFARFFNNEPREGEEYEEPLESIELMDSYRTPVSDAQIAAMYGWKLSNGNPDLRRVREARRDKTPPPTILKRHPAEPWPLSAPQITNAMLLIALLRLSWQDFEDCRYNEMVTGRR
jgi:hypothetical protein